MHKRILIADDDPTMHRLLTHFVEAEGYEVIRANDGIEAMNLMVEHGPAMVLTDWTMPRMDGLEFCQRVRSNEAFGFVYVLVMTSATTGSAVAALEAGADDFIRKPIDRRELIARLSAGQRIVDLQSELQEKTQEIFRSNATIEIHQRELIEANRRLEEMASTDALTGLCNRRIARDTMSQFWRLSERNGQPLSCIMIDIDRFKAINDTHGHATGDQVLVATARVLQDTARESDIVCRYGGEEFLVICPETKADQAAIGAERLRAAVEKMVVDDGTTRLQVTISLGVADRTEAMADVDDALNAADELLYESKHNGRNRVTVAGAAPTQDAA